MRLVTSKDLTSNATATLSSLSAGSVVFAPGELRGYVRGVVEQMARASYARLPRIVRLFVGEDALVRALLAAFDLAWPSGVSTLPPESSSPYRVR